MSQDNLKEQIGITFGDLLNNSLAINSHLSKIKESEDKSKGKSKKDEKDEEEGEEQQEAIAAVAKPLKPVSDPPASKTVGTKGQEGSPGGHEGQYDSEDGEEGDVDHPEQYGDYEGLDTPDPDNPSYESRTAIDDYIDLWHESKDEEEEEEDDDDDDDDDDDEVEESFDYGFDDDLVEDTLEISIQEAYSFLAECYDLGIIDDDPDFLDEDEILEATKTVRRVVGGSVKKVKQKKYTAKQKRKARTRYKKNKSKIKRQRKKRNKKSSTKRRKKKLSRKESRRVVRRKDDVLAEGDDLEESRFDSRPRSEITTVKPLGRSIEDLRSSSRVASKAIRMSEDRVVSESLRTFVDHCRDLIDEANEGNLDEATLDRLSNQALSIAMDATSNL